MDLFGILVGLLIVLSSANGTALSTLALLFSFFGGSLLFWIKPNSDALARAQTPPKNAEGGAIEPAPNSPIVTQTSAEISRLKRELNTLAIQFTKGVFIGLLAATLFKLVDAKLIAPSWYDAEYERARIQEEKNHAEATRRITKDFELAKELAEGKAGGLEDKIRKDIQAKILLRLAAKDVPQPPADAPKPPELKSNVSLNNVEADNLGKAQEVLLKISKETKDEKQKIRLIQISGRLELLKAFGKSTQSEILESDATFIRKLIENELVEPTDKIAIEKTIELLEK